MWNIKLQLTGEVENIQISLRTSFHLSNNSGVLYDMHRNIILLQLSQIGREQQIHLIQELYFFAVLENASLKSCGFFPCSIVTQHLTSR